MNVLGEEFTARMGVFFETRRKHGSKPPVRKFCMRTAHDCITTSFRTPEATSGAESDASQPAGDHTSTSNQVFTMRAQISSNSS